MSRLPEGHDGAAQVLVVDDDENLRVILTDRLAGSGYGVSLASSMAEAVSRLERESYQLVLLDIYLPDQSGLEGLRKILELHPSLPVILMTAHGTIGMAVEAMKEGARDFITKPIDFKRLGVIVEREIERSRMKSEIHYLRRATDEPFSEIIGAGTGLRKVMDLVRQVARSNTSVLLRGETGTGKEVIAREIHRLSPRRDRPFIVANSAAIPRELMESEMFGHVKGSFTGAISDHEGFFETAGVGTLLLDEIGDLDMGLQAKILRVLEDGSFKKVGSTRTQYNRARIIASTHQDLERLIGESRFREDLFYRLDVFPIRIPPLRDRNEDIPQLARHFLDLYSARNPGGSLRLTQEAIDALVEYSWPGNVREMRNIMERLAIRMEGGAVGAGDVELLLGRPEETRAGGTVRPLKDTERKAIVAALEKYDGNRTRAAGALGIGRRTLQNKIKLYRIDL